MDPFLGTIQAFAFGFAPSGWLICAGQILQIQQYSALFSLLGVAYGGDGRTTFGLPDLRGKVTMGWTNGTVPGITTNNMGDKKGVEAVTIAQNQLPAHTHQATASGQGSVTGTITALMNVNDSTVTQSNPNGGYLGPDQSGSGLYASTSEAGKTLKNDAITVNSSGLGINLTGLTVTVQPTTAQSTVLSMFQPSQVVNYCIAVIGIFPSRG